MFKISENAIGTPNDPRTRYVRFMYQNEPHEKTPRRFTRNSNEKMSFHLRYYSTR